MQKADSVTRTRTLAMHRRERIATRGRSGFGRADLIVCLAGLGLVLATAMPVVSKTRQQEQRKDCENRMRKMGEAVQSFANTHREILPNNRSIQPVPNSDPAQNQIGTPLGSWNAILLPYLGQEDLYKRYDLAQDWYDGESSKNRDVASQAVEVFACPANPGAGRTIKTKDATGKVFAAAPTDYCGVPAAYFRDNQQKNLHAGAMNHRYGSFQIRAADIGDGTSQTLIVVEMSDKPNGWRIGKPKGEKVKTDDKVHDAAGMGIGSGQWAAPNWNHLRSFTFDGSQAFGECAVNCNNGAAIFSFHPAGANGLMVDGSVRFLSHERTNQAMLVALVSTNGRELLPPID